MLELVSLVDCAAKLSCTHHLQPNTDWIRPSESVGLKCQLKEWGEMINDVQSKCKL